MSITTARRLNIFGSHQDSNIVISTTTQDSLVQSLPLASSVGIYIAHSSRREQDQDIASLMSIIGNIPTHTADLGKDPRRWC